MPGAWRKYEGLLGVGYQRHLYVIRSEWQVCWGPIRIDERMTVQHGVARLCTAWSAREGQDISGLPS